MLSPFLDNETKIQSALVFYPRFPSYEMVESEFELSSSVVAVIAITSETMHMNVGRAYRHSTNDAGAQ